MINQFLSSDHLDRFQGNIWGTEWRIEFLERVLKFSDKQNLVKVKHACWKILADEAVYGMNAEWLINNYGYEEMMGSNKNKFEKRYLSTALECLKNERGLNNDYQCRKAWELDFDTSVFKQTRKLKKFLKVRHEIRELDALRIIRDAEGTIEIMHGLYRIYSKDAEVISNNKELFSIYSKIPEIILIGLKEKNIKLEIDDLLLLKKESLWESGMKDIEYYLASQSKEIRLIQDMQILAKNYDSVSDSCIKKKLCSEKLSITIVVYLLFRGDFLPSKWSSPVVKLF